MKLRHFSSLETSNHLRGIFPAGKVDADESPRGQIFIHQLNDELKSILGGKMKNTFLSTILFLILGTSVASADARQNPPAVKDVVIGISDVFVPGGFDSEADTYVVVSGIFPNGCYQWKGGEVTSPSLYEHEIKSIASVSQGMCTMVLIPFAKEVRIGRLESGKHTLRFLNGDGTFLERSLDIE